MLLRNTLLLCLAAFLLGSGAGRAYAVPNFPHEIRDRLDLDYEPACGLCHAKGNTGVGTATTPFALSLRSEGLDAEDRASLGEALMSLEQDQIDSDGDGVIDVDELREDTSPNSPATTSFSKSGDPDWGCAAAPTRSGSSSQHGALALILLAAISYGVRNRRREQPPARR